MKYSDLAEKSSAELQAMLKEKKTELFTLKIKQKMMQLQNTSELRVAKKDIARMNTALAAVAK
ncbi:50S ribosomal protein L29 [Sulfurimonas autotrophica]|uniref:Large ribosomal subunit protein uL29 n=1 Tax=Sulfurimonas autotrophica (strain ATCC BAA-671 / DSM 16294 / JCM 11897 / OK10) TaxID=563040 RepID=E0UTP1_SULAO|nr:50S ribosomal protein L29 [Sulfurimonas autotrophica]ADN08272.1 LSU ribosomal protein L29P [Sulfurimonas autotrophica DSM 16294]